MTSPTSQPPRTGVPTLCGSLSLHAVGLGAAMHTAGYRALGLEFVYVPFTVTKLAHALTGVRALGIRGVGVSMPYKIEATELVDALDPMARRIGAINTVVNDGGRLTGYNTDWIGAVTALEEVTALGGARVLLLGAGGAARAIAHGLRERGAELTIANRDLAKARALAGEVGARGVWLDETKRAGSYDVLVNATSVGMSDVKAASPVAESAIAADQVVMDIVYKPIETELVQAARRRGARVVHGGRMLLHQAAHQFELYCGQPAPLEAMDAALHAQLAPA